MPEDPGHHHEEEEEQEDEKRPQLERPVPAQRRPAQPLPRAAVPAEQDGPAHAGVGATGEWSRGRCCRPRVSGLYDCLLLPPNEYRRRAASVRGGMTGVPPNTDSML